MNNNRAQKHVLVIGGAGYIGSVLSRVLLDEGYRVRVLDALLYDNAFALDDLAGRAGYSFQHGDFRSEEAVTKALERVTDVVLLAALVGDPACRKFPEAARSINDFGTVALIERLAQTSIERFVFMSTCSNYGLRADDTAAVETSALDPRSLYAETKVRVERYLLDARERLPFAFTILRSATAYGLSPRMRFDLTVNEFTRELALGHELEVYDADTWRPYCHVSDISRAILRVLNADRRRIGAAVFNVGADGDNLTKRNLVDRIITYEPQGKVKFRSGRVDPRNYRVSFAKIAGELDFHPDWTVDRYIPELIDLIRRGSFAPSANNSARYTNTSPRHLVE